MQHSAGVAPEPGSVAGGLDLDEALLIVSGARDLREYLELALSIAGFEVRAASDRDDGLRLAGERRPALVVIDLDDAGRAGIESLARLRADPRTADVAILALTGQRIAEHRVAMLEAGADDVLAKPLDTDELIARVRATLRRSGALRTASALTGLPGNTRIRTELARRIAGTEPFALLYVDVNHFKAYNDHYGFLRGDEALRAIAAIVVDTVRAGDDPDAFVGHVGGDDFVVATRADDATVLAQAICDAIDAGVADLYDPVDRARGYVEMEDRQGVVRRFPLLSIVIGIATSARRTFSHPRECVSIASELKHRAKRTATTTSSWAIDRREE